MKITGPGPPANGSVTGSAAGIFRNSNILTKKHKLQSRSDPCCLLSQLRLSLDEQVELELKLKMIHLFLKRGVNSADFALAITLKL